MALTVPTLAEMNARGESAEVLFWVGCSGSFDDRAKRITKAIARILHAADVPFAVLGAEESCTGDPAKRAGNEFLFQMQAAQNIAVLNGYGVKRIVTGCPHCFNILKNEYPELGGEYEVLHHTQFIQQLIDDGRLRIADGNPFKGRRITFHDPCYLGRRGRTFEALRELLLSATGKPVAEFAMSHEHADCSGGGGLYPTSEPEGSKEVARRRAQLDPNAHHEVDAVVTACPSAKRNFERAGIKAVDIVDVLVAEHDLSRGG